MELPPDADGNASYGRVKAGPRSKDRKGIHVRLPDEIRDRVTDEAEARGVSASWFIERLVIEGLQRLIPASEFTLTREDPEPDTRPHSRACGPLAHPHGPMCHPNCPTCHGDTTG